MPGVEYIALANGPEVMGEGTVDLGTIEMFLNNSGEEDPP